MKRFSKREIGLSTVGGLAIAVAIVLAVLLIINGGKEEGATTTTTTAAAPSTTTTTAPPIMVGHSKGWKRAAKQLEDSMDFNADPCQNFYQYACGGFVKAHVNSTADYGGYVTGHTMLQQQILEQLAMVLDNKTIDVNASRSLSQTQLAYDACLMKRPTSQEGMDRLQQLVQNYGGWPLAGDHWARPGEGSGWPWTTIGSFSHHYLLHTIFGVMAMPLLHPDENLLLLDQAQLTLPTVYYKIMNGQGALDAIGRMINATVHQYTQNNTGLNQSLVSSDIEDMLMLEVNLANFSRLEMDRRNHSAEANSFTMAEAVQRWPNFNWTTFLTALAQDDIPIGDLTMKPFIVRELNYMDRLHEYMGMVKPRTMQNYLVWRLINSLGAIFTGSAHEQATEMDESWPTNTEFADKSLSDRGMCAKMVVRYLPYVSGRIFAEKYWDAQNGNTKRDVQQMASSILDAFRGMIKGLSWMDDASKVGAYDKVKYSRVQVGYNNWIMDNVKLDAWHPESKLSITNETDSIEAILAMIRFKSWATIGHIRKKMRPEEFGEFSPARVNAWYKPWYNSLIITAGILTKPLYDGEYPLAVNYGLIGATLGHELSHGFDDQGVQWNGHGDFDTWMDTASIAGFRHMADCVVDQYSHFCYPNATPSCVNGARTQGENIADNGGIRATHRAYRSRVELIGGEPRLPGRLSTLSMDQVFFTSMANYFCAAMSGRFRQRMMLVDEHTPNDYRVNARVLNFEQFGRAFNCPLGSPMNPRPADRCRVWA